MNKQAIINLLTEKYNTFITYINSLTLEEYFFIYQDKWAAAHQLDHLVLCVKPLVQVFSMDKNAIAHTFGKSDRTSTSYESLLNMYLEKLKEGGKAPSRFVPEIIIADNRIFLTETLSKMIKELNNAMQNFSEQELDGLFIPHPLLGNLTLREMLYNAAYHVEHHQQQTNQNLKNKIERL